jgi:hypothetical protein
MYRPSSWKPPYVHDTSGCAVAKALNFGTKLATAVACIRPRSVSKMLSSPSGALKPTLSGKYLNRAVAVLWQAGTQIDR